MRKWWKDLPKAYDYGSVDKRIKRAWLQEIITEAYETGRQSAARECAEIADRHFGFRSDTGDAIRERFKSWRGNSDG